MRLWILALLFALGSTSVLADKAIYVDLAKRGWNYQLRTTMLGRDLAIPVHIHGRDLAGATLCIIGEKPHPATRKVLDAFRDLEQHVFGTPLPMRYAGRDASECGSGRIVILRLYSGSPPNGALSSDLRWMNGTYLLGLRDNGAFAATSPAMAQTFFGSRGQGTHIMVKQPRRTRPSPLEAAFYKSILIEELFQSFTFGMDILLFDRAAMFQSKLQEIPVNLHQLSWESDAFMQALLESSATGLCAFDIFMMHAVAGTAVDQTVEPGFIDYVDREYDTLLARASETLADGRFAAILAPDC